MNYSLNVYIVKHRQINVAGCLLHIRWSKHSGTLSSYLIFLTRTYLTSHTGVHRSHGGWRKMRGKRRRLAGGGGGGWEVPEGGAGEGK